MTLHSCNLRAEVSTNSIEIQVECGKCKKIFNAEYCFKTKDGIFLLEVFLKKSEWMGFIYFMVENR